MFKLFIAVIVVCFTNGECIKIQADPVLTEPLCVMEVTTMAQIAMNKAEQEGLEITLMRWRCFELEAEENGDA